jgi:hypothetical protein
MATTDQQRQPIFTSSGSAWVQPIIPHEPTTFSCSAVENILAQVYPTPSFFFPLRGTEDVFAIYENLRQGLSRLLYQQPHLAGTLRQDDRGFFSVEIQEAPNAGVRFHFKDLSGDPTFPSFEQLAKSGFAFADGDLDGLSKLRPDPFPDCIDGGPVAITQLTHLKGGLVLTYSYSHMIGDLVQGLEFGVEWAYHHRMVAEAAARGWPSPPIPAQVPREFTDRTRLTPSERSPLTLEELRSRGASFPNFKVIDPTDFVGLAQEIKQIVPEATLFPQEEGREDQLRVRSLGTWRFAGAKLKNM